MNDRMVIIAAVAVTAILCIAGMYLLASGDEQKDDLTVKVGIGMADGMEGFFADFGTYVKANVLISESNDIQIALLDGDTDVIVATSDISGAVADIFVKKVTVGGEDRYILLKEDSDKDMVERLKNWLNSL